MDSSIKILIVEKKTITIINFIICFILFVTISNSQTVYYVTTNGAGNQNGMSWSNAMGNLQNAINSANSNGGGQVWVAEGTYFPGTLRTDHFTMKNNVEIYGGFAGEETQLSQRDWENNLSILSGNIGSPVFYTDNIYQIIKNDYTENNPLDTSAILDGFVVKKGFDDTEEYSFASGLYNNFASPKILNCTFFQNKTSSPWAYVFASFSYGGAIYNSNSSPIINNCEFLENEASSDCGYSWNYAYGSAIYNINLSGPIISHCLFLENITIADDHSYGGAIYLEESTAIITNCFFNTNKSIASGAGGIHYADGGAIYNFNGSATIINCQFSQNEADNSNSSSNNSRGGAIESLGYTEIISCSFSNNEARIGGGIYAGGYSNDTTIIKNSILWGNANENILHYNGTTLVSFSCIGGGYEGEGNIDYNPRFVDAENHDLRLNCYSVCINVGDDMLVPPYILTDLNGNDRIIAGNVDMGAFESLVGPPSFENNIVYVKPEGNGCGSSWSDALHDMNIAIDIASFHALPSDTFQVWVAEGTYYPGPNKDDFIKMRNLVEIYGGFTGIETLLSQRDWENNLTIFSANIGDTTLYYDNNYRLIKNKYTSSNPLTSSAILDGFILRDGFNQTTAEMRQGGAIFNYHASPIIRNCSFLSNTVQSSSSAYGGAIFNRRSSPEIHNCIFFDNTLDGYSSYNDTTCGGAICNFNSTVIISNSIFESNKHEPNNIDSYGGAIYNRKSNVYLENCLFFSNSIIIDGYYESYGGAICNQDSSSIELYNCTIVKNEAEEQGGIYSDEGSIANITNCIIWGNSEGSLNFNENFEIIHSCIEDGPVGNGNIIESPIYFDFESNDFTLSCFSPCINTGIYNFNLINTIDLEGNIRIMNDTIDMGAYEFQDEFPPPYNGRIYVRPNGTGCGTSWGDAAGNLGNVLIRAGQMATMNNPVQVWVAAGEYFPGDDRFDHFTMFDYVEIYGGFFGTETQLSQRNWNYNITTLSGNIGDPDDETDNIYQIIKNDYSETNPLLSSAILDGFTITEAYFDHWVNCEGSALYNSYSSPVIKNCNFTHNTSKAYSYNTYAYGGAIYNLHSSPVIINCKFDSNTAITTGTPPITAYGGAIANFNYSNLTLINCSFVDGLANYAGAISNHAYSFCKIINCTFYNNGMYNSNKPIINLSNGEMEVINSIIWEDGNTPISNQGNIDVQYSCIDGGHIGVGNISENPMFEDIQNKNFHLMELSPCIDSGIPDTTGLNLPPYDLGNNIRIIGDTIDMGCYEFDPDTLTAPQIVYVGHNGSGNGTSWGSTIYNLQEAIDMASLLTQTGDTVQIWIEQGVYYPGPDRDDYFELKNQIELYGGFAGSETSLSQRDWVNNPTIISANIGDTSVAFDNNYRLFYNDYEESSPLNSSSILDGFIIKGAYCDEEPFTGGAMFNKYASPLISNCSFISNSIFTDDSEAVYGGAIYNLYSSPKLNNCNFIGNSAISNSSNEHNCGGAIYNNLSSLKLTSCNFNMNIVSSDSKDLSYGGAIFNNTNSEIEIINCSFSENEAGIGGVMYNLYGINSRIVNSTIANNIGSVGGIFNYYDCNIEIYNSIFWENNDLNLVNFGDLDIQFSLIDEEFLGNGNFYADPKFLDITNNDFQLSWQSPCINAGNPDTTGLNLPQFDLAGNPRVLSSIVDMGCYEYPYPVDVSNYSVKTDLHVCPNPSSDHITLEFSNPNIIKSMAIFDSFGKIVFQSNYYSNKIDISKLTNGIYILQLTTSHLKIYKQRFIKVN